MVVCGSTVYSDWERLRFYFEAGRFICAIHTADGTSFHELGSLDYSLASSLLSEFPALVARELVNVGFVNLDDLYRQLVSNYLLSLQG